MLDPTYKTVEIRDDMSILATRARLLLRMATFKTVGGGMILSQETIAKIIGNDKWSPIVVDAVTMLIMSEEPDKMEVVTAFLNKSIRDTLEAVPDNEGGNKE